MNNALFPRKARIAIAFGDSKTLSDIKSRLERLGHEVCGRRTRLRNFCGWPRRIGPELVIFGVDLISSEAAFNICQNIHSGMGIPVIAAVNNAREEQGNRFDMPIRAGCFVRLPTNDMELQISLETALASAEIKEARDTAVAALRESDARIRGILDVSPDSVMIVNLDGIIQDCNNSAVLMRGFVDKNELIGLNLIDLVAPEDRHKAAEYLAEISQGNASRNTECRFLRKDGQMFWAEIRARGIEDSFGNISSFACVAKDISDRKIAEEVLRASADIVEAIPSGLFIYRHDPPDRLVLMSGNPEAERLTGLKVAQWRGKEFNEIWPRAREIGLSDALFQVMETGETYETEDLQYRDERLEAGFRVRAFRLPSSTSGCGFRRYHRTETSRRRPPNVDFHCGKKPRPDRPDHSGRQSCLFERSRLPAGGAGRFGAGPDHRNFRLCDR